MNPLFRKLNLSYIRSSFGVSSFHRTHPQLENLAFAFAWFSDKGFSNKEIVCGLDGYQPEPYRLQKIDVINEVSFWNDSKSTNLLLLSLLASLLPKSDLDWWRKNKGQEVGQFTSTLFPYLEKAYLIGQTAGEILNHLVGKGVEAEICSSLKEAVFRAFENAQIISYSFSPGFASFDMFKIILSEGIRLIRLFSI